MRTADKVALLLGRMIDLLRRAPEGTQDHKATLRGLLDITGKRSLSVRLEPGGIVVEGIDVDRETPFAELLGTQMRAHGIAELRLAHAASGLDMMHLLRSIALDLTAYEPRHDVQQHLRDLAVSSVSVVTAEMDATSQKRRQMRVTDALEATGFVAAAEETSPPPTDRKKTKSDEDETEKIELVSSASGQAYDEMVRVLLSESSTLSEAISKLDADASGSALLRQLDTVQGSIAKALDRNRIDQAIDGVSALIRKEAEATSADAKRIFGVALRRLLTDQNLRSFASYLLDELYAADVVFIVRRAGKPGTKVLLELLVKAPTYAERKTYLNVLREVEEGTDAIAGMLSHPEWFVIRNMADLAGELRIGEAVASLGRVMDHKDDRVRTSVGVALARIGTPDTVQYLRKILQDPDREVRITVLKEVGGKGQGALAMPLVTALESEEFSDVRAEYLRALGRIGTQDAIEALKKAAEPGGRFLGRRAPTDRKAAVEGLALANSTGSRSALQSLRDDRSKEVREAARKALRGTLS